MLAYIIFLIKCIIYNVNNFTICHSMPLFVLSFIPNIKKMYRNYNYCDYSVCIGLLYIGYSIFSSVRYRGMQRRSTMLIGFNLIPCFIYTFIKSEPNNYSVKSYNILSNVLQLIIFYLVLISLKSIYPYMYSYLVFTLLIIIIVCMIVNNPPILSLALILCGNKVPFLTCLMRRQSWYELVSLDKQELLVYYINAIFVSHTYIIIFSKCTVFTYCILYYICTASSQYKAQYYHTLIGDG